MDNCIFCKIAQGKAKARITQQNKWAMAFVAKDETSKGHTLVIPKDHYESIFDIPKDCLQGVMELAQGLSRKLKAELGATGVNLLHASGKDAQQSVFHFHIHVVPRYPNDGLDLWIKSGIG